MKILDVKVDNVNRPEANAIILDLLKDKKQHLITTPNPEILLAAQKDQEFQNILNEACLALPDGFGLILASLLSGEILKERVCGSDFILDICAAAEKMKKSIFLLGAEEGIAAKAGAEINTKYPFLKISGTEKGIKLQVKSCKLKVDSAKNEELLARINLAKPDILFVAFGQVKQERWIAENLPNLPSVKIAMGVGGAFDFIAGIVPRAPIWMRQLGLEWLWRLIKEPRRFKRIFNAVVKFPLHVFISKIMVK